MANSLSTWSSDLYSFLERKLQSFSIREYGGVESRRSTLVSWNQGNFMKICFLASFLQACVVLCMYKRSAKQYLTAVRTHLDTEFTKRLYGEALRRDRGTWTHCGEGVLQGIVDKISVQL